MSYRIHLGVVKTTKLMAYLAANSDDYFEFGYNHWDIELYDGLDLSRFHPIDQFKDDEYCPYVLDKKDLQYILDFYKKLNRDQFKDRVKDNSKSYDSLRNELFFNRIVTYFDGLIKNNKNIDQAGLFLLDYFYLVDMYNNLKDDESILITHG